MKKVFSVKKWEEVLEKRGIFNKREIESAKKVWANDCDGLTAREMFIKHGCITLDDWMIEVEE